MLSKKKRIAAAIIIIDGKMKKIKRVHKVWVRSWIERRESLGAFRSLMNELRLEDHSQFRNFIRMSAVDFEELTLLVGPRIGKQDTQMRQSIPVKERLAVNLRFLATGDTFTSLMYLFRIPEVTISRIVTETCQAIFQVLKEEYLKCPTESHQWLRIAREFDVKWNLPNCIGALDGKHVAMQAPPSSGSYYYNYKGFHSIILMAMCDANYKFTFIDVGCNGRIADGGVFANCALSAAIEGEKLGVPPARVLKGREKEVPYVVLADDAFPLRKNIMKPYPFRNQPGAMRVFNYRLSRARRIIENAFGILSSVFRVLRKALLVGPLKTECIVLATCALHNFLITKKNSRNLYAPTGTFDIEDDNGKIKNGTWRTEGMPGDNFFPLDQLASNHHGNESKTISDEFREYFLSPGGEIAWQYKYM